MVCAQSGTTRRERIWLIQGSNHGRSEHPKLYSQKLLNNLFRHPYTKVEFIEHDLGVSRPTAMKYLDTLQIAGFVKKTKLGRTNSYINEPLFALLGR